VKPILLLAPYKEMVTLAEKVTAGAHDVEVRLGLLEQAVKIARDAEQMGVEAIISRGGTALAIQKANLTAPVVEIPVSPYDMLNALHRAKKFGKNVAVIGFDNIIRGVENLGPILDINIKIYHINNEEEANHYLEDVLKSKIDVLLGGTIAEDLAIKHGIPTVLLETGANAIEFSINEARKIVAVRRKEKEKTEQVKAILHYISEGVIAVDENGRVTTFNPAAERITGIRQTDILGKVITSVIENSKLIEVMKHGKPELGQLQTFGSTLGLTNRVPIMIKGKTVGAVATFEDVTKIQEYEEKIRSTLLAKGHIAKYSFSHILGRSKPLLEVKEKALKYAKVDSTILITGESGTGKEMFAQSIHTASRRNKGPFVAVNCAAIPENLLESELFGYEGGAFTGALKEGKKGLFTQAHGGTIFLDEVGEISFDLQARLLRVLQEREVRPLGSDKVIPIDVRVIAATNKNLLEEVNSGRFRRDLYYRLNILNLRIPTLRERKADIGLLCHEFIKKASFKLLKEIKFSNEALDELINYSWPGNIRELENVMERLAVLCETTVTKAQVREILEEHCHSITREGKSLLKEIEEDIILKTLEECQGNRTLTAKKLGISRTQLWRFLKKH
jgi:PAS domain S-box-containing protein